MVFFEQWLQKELMKNQLLLLFPVILTFAFAS
jgi:hypothetical protein